MARPQTLQAPLEIKMSDISASSLASETAPVITRLSQLRSQITRWFLVDGLSRVLWLVIGLCVLDLAIDWLFRMDKPQRVVMMALHRGRHRLVGLETARTAPLGAGQRRCPLPASGKGKQATLRRADQRPAIRPYAGRFRKGNVSCPGSPDDHLRHASGTQCELWRSAGRQGISTEYGFARRRGGGNCGCRNRHGKKRFSQHLVQSQCLARRTALAAKDLSGRKTGGKWPRQISAWRGLDASCGSHSGERSRAGHASTSISASLTAAACRR